MKPFNLPPSVNEGPGQTYQQVLDEDTRHEIPAALRFQNTMDLGVQPYLASRYTSREFFEREIEKIWLKTWQYAVREEEIPNPGDTYVYDLLDRSLLITRQADGSIKAMRNVCLHRGRKLATHSGCKEQFRCPYHGLTWNTDGSFKHNPFAWDFPQIDEKAFNLPDVRVETWAGFVFVNFDRGAAPLLDLLGDMPAHFEHWRMQDCYKAAHIAKVMPANWKACAEAFLEASHVSATHPQMGPYGGTDSTQYDLISDHVTRFLFPTGVTSEALWDGPELTEVRKIEAMLAVGSRAGLPGQKAESIDLGPGENTRTYMGEIARQALSKETGYDFSSACDGDLIDGHSYDIFPNFHIWGGFPQRICYRFRPLGMNHEQTYQEVMLFKIKPKGATPPPAAMRLLAADEPWASATELSYLAGIFDQDESNLGPQQQGLRAMGADGVVQFSRYSDMRCRNLHRMVDDYMSR